MAKTSRRILYTHIARMRIDFPVMFHADWFNILADPSRHRTLITSLGHLMGKYGPDSNFNIDLHKVGGAINSNYNPNVFWRGWNCFFPHKVNSMVSDFFFLGNRDFMFDVLKLQMQTN